MTSAKRNQLPATPSSPGQDRLELMIQYTAGLNPRGVRQIISRHGYDPRYGGNMPAFLLSFLQQGGEAALDEVLAIHPDRDLILESLPTPVPAPAAPAPAAGFSLFDGPATAPVGGTLASQLAELVNKQKAAVVDVLNRHGAAVLYDDPAQVVAREAVRALQVDNPVLVRELGALTASATTFAASYDQARTTGQLAAGTSLMGDVDVSLANDTAPIARAKLRLAIAVATLLALLLAVVAYAHFRGESN